ncbi:PhzF family phenazine biosynthesis isomerase [Pseudooceanicola sp. C21-150M6]|uniref:PhzF family phenazine biosynthesis isomerase n=1 Tax=Pseudooceanicola sp. C21-150M6 TaxID=3434355 RepID=UPI003D7FDB6C
MIVHRISAFTHESRGGNPAGVALLEGPADAAEMLRVAAEVGYSETAFLYPDGPAWRIRYFAPETEIPFCGHATIATGAHLGETFGAGTYVLTLASGETVEVEATETDRGWSAAFRSPPTWSKPMPPALLEDLLVLFGLGKDELDPRLPPALIHAGATHPLIALQRRERLSQLGYAFDQGRAIQQREGFATIHAVHCENDRLFHARGPFAVGGVYEDPATGAAAAALGGYLRDIDWPCDGAFTTIQGADMGQPSRIVASFDADRGSAVRISGSATPLAAPLDTGSRNDGWLPVFFYGLHMDTAALTARGLHCVASGPAFVGDYTVELREKARLLKKPGAQAPGILAFMTSGDLDKLYSDRPAYVKRKVMVTLAGRSEPVDCVTMALPETAPDPAGSDDYAKQYHALVRRLGLPES